VAQPYRDLGSGPSRPKIERLLVATLLEPPLREVETAAALARAVGGSVCVLHVLEALMYSSAEMTELARRNPQTHPEASRKLAEAVRLVTTLGVSDAQGSIEYGIPAEIVVRYANSGRFDLLVLGNRGRSGGVHARALAESRIPVMNVPTGAR
jgi:nucleotide-binding universal stress UspA family protein